MSGSEVEVPLSKISPAYLHSNSTSHTWAFSAIAELIDNAYDPDVSATELWIDKAMINGKQCLTIEDNGRGLDHGHLLHMLSFGYCEKAEFDHKKTHKPIGKYGNGFKSGSMRLAKDALVFTVCRTSASIGFLSQTYLQETNADSVRVPMIEYSLPGYILFMCRFCFVSENLSLTLSLEIVSEKEKGFLDSILEFSPYSQEKDIRKELENLRKSHTSHTGTKIVLFNLKRHKIGCLELDFDSDAKDIRNPETHVRDLSVEVSKSTQNETSEYLSSLRCYCSILYLKPRMKIYIRGVKVMNTLISESLSSTEKDKYKPSWLDKVLGITFGFVPSKKRHSTDDYGIMFYHRNRLIKAYEKVGYQKQPNDLGVGVVGVVHNADFLTPTHNKQDFVKDEKYNALLSALGQKLNDYWNAKKGQSDQQGTRLSTEEPDWLWVQCDECFKWRRLPDSMKQCELPDKWYCRQNPDPAHNRCDIPEEAHLEGEYTFRCTYTKAKPQLLLQESAEVEEKKAEVEAKAAELAARVAELEETQRKRARLNVVRKATKRMSSEEMPLAEKRRSVENETRNTSMVSASPSSSSAGTPGQKTDIRPVDLSNKPVVTLTVDADRSQGLEFPQVFRSQAHRQAFSPLALVKGNCLHLVHQLQYQTEQIWMWIIPRRWRELILSRARVPALAVTLLPGREVATVTAMDGKDGDVPKVDKVRPVDLLSNLATSHAWAFSAVADLIDNGNRPDVMAKTIWIDKVMIHGKPCLTIEDDGNGMARDHLLQLLRLTNGCQELNFDSDPRDIRSEVQEEDLSTGTKTPEYLRSLRWYCSILFLKPRMKIYIRGKKIRNILISESLSGTDRERYKPQWLKKPLDITFGFVPRNNSLNTGDHGIMFYHQNRLVKAYEKVGYQKQVNGPGGGVVGVVHNAGFLTQDKQDLVNDEKYDYNKLLSKLGNKLNHYYDAKKAPDDLGAKTRLDEPDRLWAQCDKCCKWRCLPETMKLPDIWECSENADTAHNSCDKPEEELEFTVPKTPKPKSEKKQDSKESLDDGRLKTEVEAPGAQRGVDQAETASQPPRLNEKPKMKLKKLVYVKTEPEQMQISSSGKHTSTEETPLAVKRRRVENEARAGTEHVGGASTSFLTGTSGQKTQISPNFPQNQADSDVGHVLAQIDQAIGTDAQHRSANPSKDKYRLLQQEYASLQRRFAEKEKELCQEKQRHQALKDRYGTLQDRYQALEGGHQAHEDHQALAAFKRKIHTLLTLSIDEFACSVENVERAVDDLIRDNMPH
ncbi:hypothetical protein BaRGS_00015608 [Batillaria attramentaria]|uniref:CW-type domain-containing protein n=1 Tax=Batillaria attramentaria TaxID=370345 RepID=A0ABD0L100_9CAEN